MKRAAAWKPHLRSALLGLVSGLFLFLSASIAADGNLTAEIIVDQPEPRRVGLKRALISVAELPDLQHDDRRRLSQDERDVLSRELREAMTGIYEQRSRVKP